MVTSGIGGSLNALNVILLIQNIQFVVGGNECQTTNHSQPVAGVVKRNVHVRLEMNKELVCVHLPVSVATHTLLYAECRTRLSATSVLNRMSQKRWGPGDELTKRQKTNTLVADATVRETVQTCLGGAEAVVTNYFIS